MAELKIEPCPFCGREMKFHKDSFLYVLNAESLLKKYPNI